MSIRLGRAVALAGSVMLLAGTAPSALAGATVFIWGANQGQDCSAAATAAERGGMATEKDIADCTAAVAAAGDIKEVAAAAYVDRGVLHLVRSENGAAISDYNAALRLDPDMQEALLNRGVALMAAGRPAEAVLDFTRLLALAPAHAEKVYFNRAVAREDMKDLKGAYLDYRKAAELDPTWDQPKKELARFTVGHAPVG